MHIYSICLRRLASSLTEIQYLQIKPGEKRTHTSESMMLKMFYLYEFFRWTKYIWWAIENNYLIVYKLVEFAVEWIPAIRNKVKIIFSSKNHLHYCNCWIVSMFCVSVVLYSLPLSPVQIKSAWLYFLLESTTEKKKS